MTDRLKLKYFFEYKYIYMGILETDSVINLIFENKKMITAGGVRTESSMDLNLIALAESMANSKVFKKQMSSFDRCVMGVYDKLDKVKEINVRYKTVNSNITRVNKQTFNERLEKLDTDLRGMIDEEVVADNYYFIKNIDTWEVLGGFGTNSNGYMTGFFSLVKGAGEQFFKMRVQIAEEDKEEDNKLHLFCTGDFLRDFYNKQGFLVTEVYEWRDEFAPNRWNYERFGRPNLYDMEKDN